MTANIGIQTSVLRKYICYVSLGTGNYEVNMFDQILKPNAVWSTKRLVEILGAASVMVVLGLWLTNTAMNYAKTRDDVEARARAYSVSMATDVHWYTEVAKQALSRAADKLDAMPSGNMSDILTGALQDLPVGVALVIYDKDGTAISRNIPGSGVVNVADRPYFQELRSGQLWAISNLISDRITGTKTFAIGHALRRDGEFAGAAVAYAPMSVFSKAWLGAGGHDANAFLIHDEGWLTARLPPLDSAVYDGKVAREFVESFKGEGGSYFAAPSPIDGIERVLGYSRVTASPLVAVVGLGIREQMRTFWHQTFVTSGILLVVLTLLTLAAARIRNLVAEREMASEQLRKALSRNESLLMEIHHRIKNNLQAVSSLVRTRLKDSDVSSELDMKINALSAVHEHLYNHEEFASAKAKSYLDSLAAKVLRSTSTSHKIVLDVDDIDLPASTLMPIGQLVTEAVINATKYGYPDGRQGKIVISLKVDGTGDALLKIHNDGQPIGESKSNGLGSRLMRAFASQIDGTFFTTSGEDGVAVNVKFPYAR